MRGPTCSFDEYAVVAVSADRCRFIKENELNESAAARLRGATKEAESGDLHPIMLDLRDFLGTRTIYKDTILFRDSKPSPTFLAVISQKKTGPASHFAGMMGSEHFEKYRGYGLFFVETYHVHSEIDPSSYVGLNSNRSLGARS